MSTNGLTPVKVVFSYEVVKSMGSIYVSYSAVTTGDLAYQYNGKEYTFSGDEGPVRAVIATDPVVKVRIKGPNNFLKETKLGVTGMGAGLLGDSVLLKDVKTKEDQDLQNYTVEVISVESVTYDNNFAVENMIEENLRLQKKKNDLQKLKDKGDNAMNRGNYIEAESAYNSILSLEKDNSYANSQLEKIKENLKNASAKKRYDETLKSAQEAESEGNLDEAERLFEAAAQENVNNSYAQNQAWRVKENKDRKIKDAQEKAKAIKEKTDKDLKEADAENNLKERENRRKLEEKEEIAKKALDARMDSLTQSLEVAEREKIASDRRAYQNEQDRLEKAKEKQENDEQKKEELARRAEDDDIISNIEKFMSDNPEKYSENLEIASDALRNADGIKPYEALELKQEWWDNNSYIQLFADDMYENQRRDNHANYIKKSFEAKSAFYTAKSKFLNAMHFVDKGSEEQKYLLKKIEYCNKRIDAYSRNYKTDFRSEGMRIKQREDAKSMAEGQRNVDNKMKARYAYATLQKDGENQARYLTETYQLADRMETAHQQYVQDAAVAGVTQSLIFDAMANGNNYVKDGDDNYMFNFAVGIMYSIVPILMNETSDVDADKTVVNDLSAISGVIGMDMWFYRSKYVDVNLGLSAGYGVMPFEGSKTSYLNYDARVNLDFGYKWVKFATVAQILGRNGTMEEDLDVMAAGTGNAATGKISKGEFDYTVFRVGGGLKIGLGGNYSNLTLLAYVEKPSFYKLDVIENPIVSFSLDLNFDEFALGFAYAQNYVIAGNKEFSLPEPKSKDYFAFTFRKVWSLL